MPPLPEAAGTRVDIARRYLQGEMGSALARECGLSVGTIYRWARWERQYPGTVPVQGGARGGRPQQDPALLRRVAVLKAKGYNIREIAVLTGKHYSVARRYAASVSSASGSASS